MPMCSVRMLRKMDFKPRAITEPHFAAIILWNTVYLSRALEELRDQGVVIDDSLLPHVAPLGWEHISLTGDYVWSDGQAIEAGRFRQLRRPTSLLLN